MNYFVKRKQMFYRTLFYPLSKHSEFCNRMMDVEHYSNSHHEFMSELTRRHVQKPHNTIFNEGPDTPPHGTT